MVDRTSWIAARAYGIWEEQGCPDGRNDEHWTQASTEYDLRARTRATDDGAEVLARISHEATFGGVVDA